MVGFFGSSVSCVSDVIDYGFLHPLIWLKSEFGVSNQCSSKVRILWKRKSYNYLRFSPTSEADTKMIRAEQIAKLQFLIGEIDHYLAHVIEQPIFQIPNLEYLQRNFVYLLDQQ